MLISTELSDSPSAAQRHDTQSKTQIVSNVVNDETALKNASINVDETNQQMRLKNIDNHNISEGNETTWRHIPGQR